MKMKSIWMMILSLGLLCVLLMAAPASVVSASDENLAVNGDLEMGSTNGWEIDNATIDSTVAHSGKYSLKLNATAAYSGAAYKAIPVRKNATVTVSFWYRYTENPSFSYRYHVYTYQGDNPWGSAYKGADASFVAVYDTYDTWQQASYTFNSGDYDSIYLKFCPGGSGSYACYIDDLVVTAEGGDMPNVEPYLTSFGTKLNRPKDAASNLIKNGGFESTSGAQWNTTSFIKGNLRVVSDSTAPEGNKSLYLSGDSATTRYVFPVTVEKNTQYVFSAWVKSPRLSGDNDATATFGVMNASTNKFLIYAPYNGAGKGAGRLSTDTMQLMATSPDDEWHLRSVTLNSGSHTTLYIAVYGVGSQLYLDDMALFKLSNGMEYISPLRTEAIDADPTTGNKYCADEDSLISGIYMTTEEAQKSWSDNPAWRNGFLSFTDAREGHGTVLKYTASAHPEWQLHYIDWIDVQPNTTYTLTLDVKRLATGNGKIALFDDKAMYPYTFYTIAFNEVDKDWVTYSVTFDSSVYSRIGFAIVDGGGSALIDNVRLFESSKGVSTAPVEGVPTLHPQNVGTSVMEMTTGEQPMQNSGFEEGMNAWMPYQQTVLSETAAYGGAYGAHLKGDGSWGALLEQKNIPVVEGKTYTLSFWYKANQNGSNVTLFGTDTNTRYANVWAAANQWTRFTATFTVEGDTSVWFNACGAGNGVAEDLYIDNVRLIPEDSTVLLGIAFLVEQQGNRILVDGSRRVNLASATVAPYGDSKAYPLLRMGTVITNDPSVGTDKERMTLESVNGIKVVNVPVEYLWSVTSTGCEYAVRVSNVPLKNCCTEVYARPYYVFLQDGKEVVAYGDIVSRSYDG